MRFFGRIVALMIGISAIGCGETAPSATAPVDSEKARAVSSTADLKKRLEEMAQSGSGGSAALGLTESINQNVRPTNAKLADELAKDVESLVKTQDAAEIKTIIARMVSKL